MTVMVMNGKVALWRKHDTFDKNWLQSLRPIALRTHVFRAKGNVWNPPCQGQYWRAYRVARKHSYGDWHNRSSSGLQTLPLSTGCPQCTSNQNLNWACLWPSSVSYFWLHGSKTQRTSRPSIDRCVLSPGKPRTSSIKRIMVVGMRKWNGMRKGKSHNHISEILTSFAEACDSI